MRADAVEATAAPALAPPTMPTLQPTDVDVLNGVVHEVQSVGHYTYVRLGDPQHEGDWAVVMGSLDAAPGDTLTVSVLGSQTNFHSRRLDRDFEQLFFASVPSRA